jgi:ribulose-bisphosphate carboxylase large chain
VSGSRFLATYAIAGPHDTARERAEGIAVEQTIEFPADLIADDDIRRHVIGRIESVEPSGPDRSLVRMSYAAETTGGELPQLLNVLFGNCSLYPGVRLVGLDLPPDLLDKFPGPRFGVPGLRALLGVPTRPLLATALKPMGLDADAFAEIAATLVRGGVDIIKDDHGLANQPFAPWEERVRACATTVRRANEATGSRTLYMPSLNGPADEIAERARIARDAGAGGLLVLPGLAGLDTMRWLASDGAIGLPVMGHPAFMGSFVIGEDAGIEHGLLFGTIFRLAGADLVVFPSYGGRFSFSREACASIARACRVPLGDLPAIFPAPGGGMTLDRVGEIHAFYGPDTALLVGGDLHRGDLRENVARMLAAVEAVPAAQAAFGTASAPQFLAPHDPASATSGSGGPRRS